ncbi:nuclear transport factor 2-like protein [Streptomyces odonnellii]|uniref:hypothetical protein n=1 Tax=Streptomyces odonnellii TaxID=1417980 RepID=UPI000A6AC18F|nr:hypothetical protein [Streptomyces odonnellii]
MTHESAMRIAEILYDAVEQRDFETVLGILDNDATLWNEHERSDHSAREFFGGSHALWSAVASLRYTERKYTPTEHGVSVEYVARGLTVRGRRFTFPVTARLFLSSDGHRIRRIEEFFRLTDAAAFQEALID